MLQSKEIIFIVIIGTFIIIILSLALFIFFGVYQKKQFKFRLEKQRLQTQFSQTLLQSQLEIQEQTLQHISHELHDNLGQIASLIKINLNTLLLSDIEKAEDKIEVTKELTRQLIGDLKSLSVSLSADRIVQTGLAKALETEMERLNKTGQFTASITLKGNIPTMDNDKTVILYRMSQEILNNIVKHSGAKQITILLNASEKLFTLAFNDDGVGFDMEAKKNCSGAGLHNLRNRAKLINAQFDMQSTPGNGTRVTIELPL